MEVWLWALCGLFALIILLLILKLYLMRKYADEICEAVTDRLAAESNVLIDISSRDSRMRRLADALNLQLRRLRSERNRYQQGDTELKESVTNISHDLRTPLTAICGYLDLLSQEALPEQARRYLGFIENRTTAMKQLTAELFRYSIVRSTETEQPEQLTLNRVLEESLASYYAAMCQKQITPVISIPEQPVRRCLDPTALTRIFENILSNVLKYSDGDLSVIMDSDGKISFSNKAASLTPVLTGQLFNRFYTVETGRNSTGLGLSIAKLLTERMGGQITAKYQDETLSIQVWFPA